MTLLELDTRQKAFRNAMASMAAAVSVVTTNGTAGRSGITATAVCSITDTPPTIMVCINRNSKTNATLKENQYLCVNILSAEQLEIAQHFAGMTEVKMSDRFMLHNWKEGTQQIPVLDGALANLQGKISSMSEMGTHTLFFVELNEIEIRENGNSLIYFNRAFHEISRS
ncbi:4-hydroxyphenylacetate 3-monooxygenase, reductase component [Entomomonas moraniae]|uniref:4-hydroxyphenylacetate 3-monooxygenase reductase component n=1 Tax=Entomomonas moraniae TaxID=2213226 RepID=A0A3S9XAC3_9GAMM|nr:4-hydroxyphenylacetate 3-monooxygenase, reductase component [Entomomonas moraniae]AZS49394.1 4-hydroxyphenylacetate 3-monooxygenase, reductase component [Entomomonas moraniae]